MPPANKGKITPAYSAVEALVLGDGAAVVEPGLVVTPGIVVDPGTVGLAVTDVAVGVVPACVVAPATVVVPGFVVALAAGVVEPATVVEDGDADGVVTVFVSMVTAPFQASARPLTVESKKRYC